MRDYLKDLPRWALVGLLLISVPAAAYTVQQHLSTDHTQSEDIRSLAATVSNLTVVVEYNYKETEKNTNARKELRDEIKETQLRLERIMGRIEAAMKEKR